MSRKSKWGFDALDHIGATVIVPRFPNLHICAHNYAARHGMRFVTRSVGADLHVTRVALALPEVLVP